MKIQVIRRKLGKEKADGLAWESRRTIEIDPRLKPKRELEILIHESLHILFPGATEAEIQRAGLSVCNVLWKEGFRKL